MNPHTPQVKPRAPMRRRSVLLGFAIFGAALLFIYWLRSGKTDDLSLSYYEVKRGDFTVSVVEGGNLAAVAEVSIRSDVEGIARIISIVPEGSYVKKGTLLVELDSAQAQDQVNEQNINFERSVSSFEQAKAQLEIQRSTTNSEFLAAQMKLKFAEIDRDKYDQGQRMVDLVEASNKLVSAQAQLLVNQVTLSNSIRLNKKGYETKQKVDGDQLSVLNSLNSVIVASNAIQMLRQFDIPKQTNKFSSDVLQSQQELERVVNQNKRLMARYEADLNAQSNTLALSEQKLARDRRNLSNTVIRAPQDGLVVYAVTESHFSSESLIEGGATVRNRQELIKLPDLSRMKVNVKIHESHINMIKPGLPAFVILDSVPDQRFEAYVEKVAPLPDTQARWGNPNLKVYNTEIFLNEPIPNVKPGVSAKAEIIITNIANALSVPIQSVSTYQGKPVVYVMNGSTSEPRPVETGMYNTKSIEIVQGLKEGDLVMLSPPFDLQEKDLEGGVLTDDEKSKVSVTNGPPRTELPPDSELRRPPPEGALRQADGNGDRGLRESDREGLGDVIGGGRTNQIEPRRDGNDGRLPAAQGARPDSPGQGRTESGRMP